MPRSPSYSRTEEDSHHSRYKDNRKTKSRERSSSRDKYKEKRRYRESSKHSSHSSSPAYRKSKYQKSPNSYSSQSRHKSRSSHKSSKSYRNRSSSSSSTDSSRSCRSASPEVTRKTIYLEEKTVEPIKLNEEIDQKVIEEIEANNFIPKSFTSVKKVSEKVIIDLQKETVSIPKFQQCTVDDGNVFHPNFLGNEEKKIEKWTKKLYIYRQKYAE